MFELLRFLRGYRTYRKIITSKESILLHHFDDLSHELVDREEYMSELSEGKRVLHFGFLDSIFLERKLGDGSLLHGKLGRKASYLYGVDIDETLLQKYRSLTGDRNNILHDISDGTNVPDLNDKFDLILFPEVLEHVLNPGIVLVNLRQLCIDNNAMLCITVPNAFHMYGFIAAMHGKEVVHPDHSYYFSPQTLTRLLSSAKFSNITLKFYNYGSSLAPGLTKAGIIAVCKP